MGDVMKIDKGTAISHSASPTTAQVRAPVSGAAPGATTISVRLPRSTPSWRPRGVLPQPPTPAPAPAAAYQFPATGLRPCTDIH